MPYTAATSPTPRLVVSRPTRRPEWRFDTLPPTDWDARVAALGGGLFHTPAALRVSMPPGEPVYATLEAAGGGAEGIAFGIVRRCRLARRPRHWYFATPPLVSAAAEAAGAMDALARGLWRRGAAEIVIDSFDALAAIAAPSAARAGKLRHEFVLDLRVGPAKLLDGFHTKHRARVRRGDRREWSFRVLGEKDAGEALHLVQGSASRRAAARGEEIVVLSERELAHAPEEIHCPWGLRAWAAYAGDDLLAAALVGWGGARAYYLIGGSTPLGYEHSAAPWLHWRIMNALRERGCDFYNLGGAPVAAADATPPRGLTAFKMGFGAAVVPCAGAAWVLRPHHLRAHRAAEWVAAHLPTRAPR